LSAAPGISQTVTDRLTLSAKEKSPDNDLGNLVSVHLDDVYIAGSEFQEMRQKLQALFNRLRAAGFLLKANMCELFQEKVIYLGHVLCKEGLKMERTKINRIIHWPEPKSVRELKSWLGFVGYYQYFIPNFARLCSPFYMLRHKNQPYRWTEECRTPFKKLQAAVTPEPVLGIPKEDGGKFI